ncbi:hypothetical protein AAFF_G00238760 [Aldrovandia affinis]|uniref:Ig-like domain-containing protein n=1 Tax=Aldrovandia affinis TaxID=143900 RepID=A0AAD7RE13_9TELE|nr:hypothetical protein AAFF_G00238760 [Aldrovandia affinis]
MGILIQTANLLLLIVWASVASSTGSVFQAPRLLKAPAGAPLTLNCSFLPPEEALRIRVTWDRCPKPPDSSQQDCQTLSSDFVLANRNSSSRASANRKQRRDPEGLMLQVTGGTESRLTLQRPGLKDSGWYRCSVKMEIPRLWSEYGNGTEVVVMEALAPSDLLVAGVRVAWWVWALVGAGSATLVAVTVGLGILCRKRRTQGTESPIYDNYNPRAKSCVATRPPPHPGAGAMPASHPLPCVSHPRAPRRPKISNPGKGLHA